MSKSYLLTAFCIATACLEGCAHRAAENTRTQAPGGNRQVQEADEEEMFQGPTITELRRAASGIVGCRPEEIDIQEANYAEFHEVWVLSCRSGHWICSRQDMPMQEYLHCSILAGGGVIGSL